jgi:uncharacterized protein YdaU (DUF1376 family)
VKAPSPAFSYYPKDIMSDEDCAAMTLEEFGAYHRLLCHAWLEGSIPKDKTKLARLLRVNRKKLDKLWPAIEPCWGAADETDRLVQRRLDEERRKQLARSGEQAERGRMGGRPSKSTKEESQRFTPEKPPLSEQKPGESLPSSSPSASPNDKERKTAPLLTSDQRAAMIRQGNEDIRLIAEHEDLDPTEVAKKATAFKSHSLVNLENASDERLAHSTAALRSWVRRIKGQPEPEAPRIREPEHLAPKDRDKAVYAKWLQAKEAESGAQAIRGRDAGALIGEGGAGADGRPARGLLAGPREPDAGAVGLRGEGDVDVS